MEKDYLKEWEKQLSESAIAYPSEYVIRIFKGTFPRMKLSKNDFKNKKICDAGCGDGRNCVLLSRCGFDTYGTEVNAGITEKIMNNLTKLGINSMIKVGTNDNMPFEDEYFDYLLSWNACYYMGEKRDFNEYVNEFARIIKKDGYLILSIPKKSCFIYKGSDVLKPGYQIIRKDPFGGIRNGEILRMFEDEKEIEDTFSPFFKDFIFASIHDDCFGYEYHWHLAVARKK